MNRLPVSPLLMRGLELAEKHLGLDELCKRLGTTPATIRAWRTGEAAMPDRDFLKLIDLLTDLEPGWLFKKPRP